MAMIADRGYEPEFDIEETSESDNDSLTNDLEQIGRLKLSLPSFNLGSYFNKMAGNLPNFEMPKLASLSQELSNYVDAYRGGQDQSVDQVELINSLKTSVSTRIQMANFLNDLKLGFNISTAIDRLQPLKDVVHEAISLPAEDISDFDDDYGLEEHTEPLGVNEIVNEERLFINDIIKPEARRYNKPLADMSDVDGLSFEEVRELTDMSSAPESNNKQDLMRKKIQKIHGMSKLSQVSKNKLVTRLMNGNSKSEPPVDIPMPEATERDSEYSSEEIVLTDRDLATTYHDPPFNTCMGCPHYQRNCKLECPTCLNWYTCRFCHDNEVQDHKMMRSEVRSVLCMNCNTPQAVANNYCGACGYELANYFCSICVLYDNDPSKDIYHCDKCGICRLGLGIGKDYFHCDTCNICLSIDLKERHKCVANTTHCNCPICNEYLFTSINKVVFMKCGHSIHQACYEGLSKHSYKCPLCKKTVVNVEAQFRILDQEIQQSPLPAPYNQWKCVVVCNDCKGKSYTPYHVLGLKCKYCKSYNTNQLKIIKPEEEDNEISTPEEDTGNTEEPRFRLVDSSLRDNFEIDEQSNDYDGDINDSDGESMDDEEDENLVDLKRITQRLVDNIFSQSDSTISFLTSRVQSLLGQKQETQEEHNEEAIVEGSSGEQHH